MKVVNCGYNYCHPKGFRIYRPGGSGDYILLIVRSAASFILEGQVHTTNGNAVIIFNKGTPQMYGSDNAEYINDWVHFECNDANIRFLAELGIVFDKIIEFPNVTPLTDLVKHMFFERYSNNKNSTQSAELYLDLIMLKIADMCEQKQINDTKLHKQLLKLRNNILSNPQKDWNLDEIAKSLAISKSFLQHQYKFFFNTGIKRDIILSRIEHSKYLLFSTDYTVSIIADLCGYKNDVHFMRTFKKETGLTPTEYRKSMHYSHTQMEEARKGNPFSAKNKLTQKLP